MLAFGNSLTIENLSLRMMRVRTLDSTLVADSEVSRTKLGVRFQNLS